MDPVVVPFHLDEDFPLLELGITGIVVQPALPEGTPWQRMAVLYEHVAQVVAQEEFPVVLSADCTTSLGVLGGLQRRGIDAGAVWFDAHGDLNTEETTLTGYLGGMPLAVALGRGDATVRDHIGLRPLDPARVVLVDIRDIDPAERELVDATALRLVSVEDIASGLAPDGPIYVHVDLDAIDPSDVPGLLGPTPNGPSLDAVLHAVRRVFATGRVVAVGIAATVRREHVAEPRLRKVVEVILRTIEGARSATPRFSRGSPQV